MRKSIVIVIALWLLALFNMWLVMRMGDEHARTVAQRIRPSLFKDTPQSGYSIVINAHPAVAEMLGREESDAVKNAESRYRRTISVRAKADYHLEQYDLQSKS